MVAAPAPGPAQQQAPHTPGASWLAPAAPCPGPCAHLAQRPAAAAPAAGTTAELASLLNHELSVAGCEASLRGFSMEPARTDSSHSEGILVLLDDGAGAGSFAASIETAMLEELAAATAQARRSPTAARAAPHRSG